CQTSAGLTAAATDRPPQGTTTVPLGSEEAATTPPAAFSGPLTLLAAATAPTRAGTGGTPSKESTKGSRDTRPCDVSEVMPMVTASGSPPGGRAPLVGTAVARSTCQRKSAPTVVA